MLEMLRSKIHRATVNEADLNYEGSISISEELMAAAKLYEYQKVMVANINNGERFETYVIKADKPGYICLNGAAARLVHKGDLVIIMSFVLVDETNAAKHSPIVVKVDAENKII